MHLAVLLLGSAYFFVYLDCNRVGSWCTAFCNFVVNKFWSLRHAEQRESSHQGVCIGLGRLLLHFECTILVSCGCGK